MDTWTDPDRPADSRRRRTAWVPWAAATVALVLVGGYGAHLLTRDGDPAAAAAGATPDRTEPTGLSDRATRPRRPREPAPSATPTPTPTPTPEAVPADLARFADVTAPPAAPASRDLDGNAVRYEATNLLDGVAETTWRTPGDATGATLTFTFDEPVALSEVGLINGYAKVGEDASGPLDWYHGNRRVLAVEWVLDDGTTLDQSLGDTTVVQTVAVDGLETRTVQLRLVQVSGVGSGRAARDYTAISDVRLVGVSG